MLCPLCHTQNRENARFCKGCGRPLNEEEMAETAHATPPQIPAVQASPSEAASDAAPTQQADQTTPTTPPTTAEQEEEEDWQSNDLSQFPTQILTPQQMVEYRKRQWNMELENKQSSSNKQHDIADLPTVAFSTEETPMAEQPSSEIHQRVEEQPAVNRAQNSTAGESGAPAVTPASQAVKQEATKPEATGDTANAPSDAAATAAAAQTVAPPETQEAATTSADEQPPSEEAMPAQKEEQTSQQDGAFPPLAEGTLVGNSRYEVTQVLDEEGQEHTYQVIDHQGYQHCWNCGSEQNSEGDEFCIDCGARLLDAQYILHEYPSSAAQGSDAHVLAGTIINTFVDNERTYVVEQQSAAQEAFPNGVRLLAASDSDAGDVRRSEPNEDSTLVLQFERIHESISAPVGIFVVADGMGGHANGQLASHMVISTIAERCAQELILAPLTTEQAGEQAKEIDEDGYVALVQGAIEDANTTLCQANQREKSDMGSTLTGFMMVGNHAFIFNVGDSRTYMFREGNLYQLTTDHSLVGQLVAGGLIEPDEVYTHPQRNQIFRSIGDKMHVQIDVFKQEVHPGDILLSCSDGLWEMVRNPQITDILDKAPDPQTACTQLIEAANTNGGEDNVSAVVVYVR